MKTVTIAYLPAPSDPRFPTTAFLKNLQQNPAAGPLILFSDHTQPDCPGALILGKLIERDSLRDAHIIHPVSGKSVPNKAAINNMVFFTALRIVEKHGFTHFLYLEVDCRVGGAGWDTAVFEQFFNIPRHLIAGGSVVAFNPYNHTLSTARRFEQYLIDTERDGRRHPIPVYGWMGANDGRGSNIFINGAGGVYSVAGLKHLFPERNNPAIFDTEIARALWAWDFEIGLRAWQDFGPDVYEIFGYLPIVYSSFGNVLTTEEERLAMLKDGFRIVHQVKSEH